MIYTYIGPVLLSVNPFKNINGLYSPQKISEYRGKFMYEGIPHVFALAEDTYRQLKVDRIKVVFTGRVLEGFRSEDVRESFAQLFSASEQALNRLLFSAGGCLDAGSVSFKIRCVFG